MQTHTNHAERTLLAEMLKDGLRNTRTYSAYQTSEDKMHELAMRAATNYSGNLRSRYGFVKVLGMSKPISLGEIYTKVKIRETISHKRHVSIYELQRRYITDQSITEEAPFLRPAIDAVMQNNRLMFLGKPGSGKTTFLKHVLFSYLGGNLPENRIPVFISLHDVYESGLSLHDYLYREFLVLGVGDTNELCDYFLQHGRLTLLLDGLDEVRGKDLESLVTQILDFSQQYFDTKFIVSCRIAAYDYWFDNFVDVEVAEFTKDDIEHFINKWFSDERRGKMFLETLENRSGIFDLATTPLLLTMLCLSFDETLDISTNRAEIYKDAVDTLLKRWDTARRIKREEMYKTFTTKRKEHFLSFLAARTFEDGRYFFSDRYLEQVVQQFLVHVPEIESPFDPEIALYIVKAIEAHHGLLSERAKGIFSFSHLTFHEFFTANYIALSGEDIQKSLVRAHLFDAAWREVIILTICLLPSADRFLLEILKKISALGIGASHVSVLEKRLGLFEQGNFLFRTNPKRQDDASDLKDGSSRTSVVRYKQHFALIQGGIEDLDYRLTKRAINTAIRAIKARRPGLSKLADYSLIESIKACIVEGKDPYNWNIQQFPPDPTNSFLLHKTISADILKRYHDLGGEIDTEGPEQKKIDVMAALLKENGVIAALLDEFFEKILDGDDDLATYITQRNINELYNNRQDFGSRLGQFLISKVAERNEVLRILARRIMHGITTSSSFFSEEDIINQCIAWMDDFITGLQQVAKRFERDWNLCIVGESLGEILLSPVYIRIETRDAAIKVLKALSSTPTPTPEGPGEPISKRVAG